MLNTLFQVFSAPKIVYHGDGATNGCCGFALVRVAITLGLASTKTKCKTRCIIASVCHSVPLAVVIKLKLNIEISLAPCLLVLLLNGWPWLL